MTDSVLLKDCMYILQPAEFIFTGGEIDYTVFPAVERHIILFRFFKGRDKNIFKKTLSDFPNAILLNSSSQIGIKLRCCLAILPKCFRITDPEIKRHAFHPISTLMGKDHRFITVEIINRFSVIWELQQRNA